jgi:hypothetical protein
LTLHIWLSLVSLICLALLHTLETSEKKLNIYLPLNASTGIGASSHNKLIIMPTNFSGLFTCTWNATDKGNPKYLDKNLSSGQSGIETGFLSPILSYFTLPLSFHKCSILTFHSCSTDTIFSVNDSVANETPLYPFLRRTLRPSRFLHSRFACVLNDPMLPVTRILFGYPDLSWVALTLFGHPDLSWVALTLFGYPDLSWVALTLFGYPDAPWLR